MYIQKGKESNSLSYQRSLPSGKEAVSINFSRLRETRDSYGYGGGGQNSKIDKAYPKDDGIFLVNLESGKAKLIVSLLEIKKYVPKLRKTEFNTLIILYLVEKVQKYFGYREQNQLEKTLLHLRLIEMELI